MSTGACLSCYPSYSLNKSNGKCLFARRDPNCRIFLSDGKCSECS